RVRLVASERQPTCLLASGCTASRDARHEYGEMLVVMSHHHALVDIDPLREEDVGRSLDERLIDVEDVMSPLGEELTYGSGYVLTKKEPHPKKSLTGSPMTTLRDSD